MAGHFYQFLCGHVASRQELRILTFLKNSFPLSPFLSKEKQCKITEVFFEKNMKVGANHLTSSELTFPPRTAEGAGRKGKVASHRIIRCPINTRGSKEGGQGDWWKGLDPPVHLRLQTGQRRAAGWVNPTGLPFFAGNRPVSLAWRVMSKAGPSTDEWLKVGSVRCPPQGSYASDPSIARLLI